MNPSLFPPKRICCVCGCEASSGAKTPPPGEPEIVSVSQVVYRRGKGKGQLRNAQRVQVCADCLTKTLTAGRLAWLTGENTKLWNALRSTLLDCYGKMTEDDAFRQVRRPDWRNPETELL